VTPNKAARQRAILQLIASQHIANQEELRQLLAERDFDVTQATLSRDLRDLRVVRAPGGEGARYLLPATAADSARPTLENMMPQLFASIDGVGELLVLHTISSGAQPVAEALDGQGWSEVLGTIAGENTVLIICRSTEARDVVRDRIERLARRGESSTAS
jgi:transcriptional regulator of arginine metabolism